MMYNFEKNMGLVCHDAGAANVLIAAFMKEGMRPVMALMDGPAKDLWEKAFPDIPCNYKLKEIVNTVDFMFTGTGWSSSLEFDAIHSCNEKGLFCSALIDHWVNYEDRFIRKDKKAWPNRFLVTDSEAYKIACLSFPSKKVFQCKNFYLEDQVNKILSLKKNSNKQLLYICEPIRSKWGRDKEGEFQALEYFLQMIEKFQIPKSYKILLRQHPSEPANKYASFIPDSEYLIETSKNHEIARDIAESTFIFGCNSYGLVLSLAANKPTYNVIPPWGPVSSLPHIGIKPLIELINKL
jgi:hypothetical protein